MRALHLAIVTSTVLLASCTADGSPQGAGPASEGSAEAGVEATNGDSSGSDSEPGTTSGSDSTTADGATTDSDAGETGDTTEDFPAALPSWVPEPGEVAVLTTENGGLTNTFRSTVAPYYGAFWSVAIVNDYSGSAVNPHFGPYGAIVFEGAGHSGSNDNSVMVLELGAEHATFRRVTDPTPLFGDGGDPTTQGNNSVLSAEVTPLTDFTWGEYTVDQQPVSRHSYGATEVIGPEDGGAQHGTYLRLLSAAGAYHGASGGEIPHKVDFTDTTSMMAWSRAADAPGVSGPPGTPGVSTRAGANNWTTLVAEQGRVYLESNAMGSAFFPRWFDLAEQTYVTGTGTARNNDGDGSDQGIEVYVGERQILVHLDAQAGALRVRTMDVSQDDPSWNNTARVLSEVLPVSNSWSAAAWCEDSHRMIIGHVGAETDAVYEIEVPEDLADTWEVTRAPFGAGQSITWAPSTTYKKWSYNPMVKAIVYFPYAAREGDDTVFVYRPRGTGS